MDGHVHIINRQLYLGGDISDHYKDGQVDLPRIRKGGVNAIFFSLFTSDNYYPNRFELKETMILMDLALRQIRKNQDQIELARNASDIERIYKSGKIAAFLHLEGSLRFGWRSRPAPRPLPSGFAIRNVRSAQYRH